MTLTPGQVVTVSSEHDRADVAFAPAVAVGADGVVVVWAAERRDDELGDRILLRVLAREATATSEPIELGRGYAPDVAAGPDGYVVAWRPSRESGASFALAKVGHDSSVVASPVSLGDVPTAGTPSVTVHGTVVAVACADEGDDLIILREPFDAMRIELFRPRSGCNDAHIEGWNSGAIAAVATDSFRGTQLVALAGPTATSNTVVSGHCAAIPSGGGLVLACIDEPDARDVYLRTETGESKRADVELGGGATELRAVALEGGVLLAWTVETADGFMLRAALIRADGQALTPVVDLGTQPAVPRFDLAGDGSSAWVVFVTERQVDATRYSHDVVLVQLRVTGT